MISFSLVDYIALGWFKRFNSGVIGHTIVFFLGELGAFAREKYFSGWSKHTLCHRGEGAAPTG